MNRLIHQHCPDRIIHFVCFAITEAQRGQKVCFLSPFINGIGFCWQIKGSFARFLPKWKAFCQVKQLFYTCWCVFLFVCFCLGFLYRIILHWIYFLQVEKKKKWDSKWLLLLFYVRVSSVYHRAPAGEHGPVEHINTDIKDRWNVSTLSHCTRVKPKYHWLERCHLVLVMSLEARNK